MYDMAVRMVVEGYPPDESLKWDETTSITVLWVREEPLVAEPLKKWYDAMTSLLQQAAELACAARLTNATRSPKTPFGRLSYIIKFSSIQ